MVTNVTTFMKLRLVLLILPFQLFAITHSDSLSRTDAQINALKLEIVHLKKDLQNKESELNKLRELSINNIRRIIDEKENQQLLKYDQVDSRVTVVLWALGFIATVLTAILTIFGIKAINKAINEFFGQEAEKLAVAKIDEYMTEDWLIENVNKKTDPLVKFLKERSESLLKDLDKIKKHKKEALTDQEKRMVEEYDDVVNAMKSVEEFTSEDWYWKATKEVEDGHYAQAEKSYLKSLELDPNNSGALNDLGFLYDRYIVDKKKSFQYFKKATEADSTDYLPHYNLGVHYDEKKEYPTSINHYQKSIELNSEYFDSHHNLGLIYSSLDQDDIAITYLKKATELKPNGGAYNSLGFSLIKLGELDRAEEVLKNSTDNEWAHLGLSNLGHIALIKNQIDDAINFYLESLNRFPDKDNFWNDLQEDYESALKSNGVDSQTFEHVIIKLKETGE